MIVEKELLQNLQQLEDDWLLCRYGAAKNINKIQSFHKWYDYAFSLFAKYVNDDPYFQDFSKIDLDGNIYALNSEYNKISHIYQYLKNKLTEDIIMDEDIKGIFISHSESDKEIVERLVALIQCELGINPSSILCTSLPGYGIGVGKNINKNIRHYIDNSKLMISVLTQNSLNAKFVLFETGARWYNEKPLYAVVVDSSLDKYLFKPLDESNFILLNSDAKVMELLENIGAVLNRDLNSSSSLERIQDFVKFLSK